MMMTMKMLLLLVMMTTKMMLLLMMTMTMKMMLLMMTMTINMMMLVMIMLLMRCRCAAGWTSGDSARSPPSCGAAATHTSTGRRRTQRWARHRTSNNRPAAQCAASPTLRGEC